jgi:hypothetical protein
MAWHQYSMRQLFLSLAGICIGFSGIAFAMRPMDLPLHPSYDRLATILPVVKVFGLVTGCVIFCLAIIPLITKRRPVPILILMLGGIFLGLFLSSFAANAIEPNHRYRSATPAQRRRADLVHCSGAVLGGLFPLMMVVWSDWRRPKS